MIGGKELQQCPCSRRTALKFGAGVVGALCSGATLTGCGEATLDGPVTLALSDYAELAEIGGVASVPSADSGFKFVIFIYRRGEDDYLAYSGECTHFGCEIELKEAGYECGCHGSKFTLEGVVTEGPAKQDLVQFDVTVDGDAITLAPQ